ncbi:MAG: hypothetical protein WBD51_15780, partial [Burkholderiaceae bacterium]
DVDKFFAYGVMAKSAFSGGELHHAERYADLAEAILARSAQTGHYLIASFDSLSEYYWQALVEQKTDAVTDTKKRLKRLGAKLNQLSFVYPVAKPSVYLARGRYSDVAGKEERAIVHWGKALNSAVEFGMPHEAEKLTALLRSRSSARVSAPE